MSKDATPKGVSKKPEGATEEQQTAVNEVRESALKEENEGRQELADKHREHRDAELSEAGHEVEDTTGDIDKVIIDDPEKEEKPKEEAVKKVDTDKKSDTKVDKQEEFVTLTIDGKETEVSKSKILDAGTRAMQKESAADTRLEEATRILTDAKATAEQLKESSSQPSATDVDDTASKIDKEALAKTLVDGSVDEVAEAIGTIMGTGRQDELATQAVKMQPDDVYGMVEGALQMKDAMDTFQGTPESGGYGDLYADETMRQMVFDKEADLAKGEKPGTPGERLKEAAESVREWKNNLVKESGGNVVDFGERSSKKANADSTASSAGGRKPADTNEQPKSEADKRRETLSKMSRSRGQHLD